MKLRLAQPKHLVDLRKVPGLSGIKEDGGTLVIGAMTTHYAGRVLGGGEVEVSGARRRRPPMIGDPVVRNMGTIGGAWPTPTRPPTIPATAIALGAELVAEGPKGKRTVKVDDLFKGLMTTALGEDEILDRDPRARAGRPGSGAAYMKFPHPASRFAVVGVAAVLTRRRRQVHQGQRRRSPAPAPRRCAPRAWRPR